MKRLSRTILLENDLSSIISAFFFSFGIGVLLSTDMSLPEEEIIRIYGKRWQIEVFFKVCKSHLRLTEECHSRSFDAVVAWNAVVITRYIMLALDKRLEEDPRSFGELFFDICGELPDVTLMKALLMLLDTFLNVTAEKYFLADDEIGSLLDAFMDALPEPFKKNLKRCARMLFGAARYCVFKVLLLIFMCEL